MRRKFRRKPILLKLLLGIVAVTFISFLIFKVKLFNINKVEIVSKDIGCITNEEVKGLLRIEGKNIFTLRSAEVEKDILKKFICIKSVRVTPSYPNKINLELSPRQPAVRVLPLEVSESTSSAVLENIATPSSKLNEDSYLVDEEGVLFAKTSDLFEPAVFVSDADLFLAKKMNKEFRNSLKILEKLKIFKVKVSSALILDDYFILYSLPKIIFKLDNEVDTQIASLQLILEKAKIDSEVLEFIDLRFDKPIVRFAPKKK